MRKYNPATLTPSAGQFHEAPNLLDLSLQDAAGLINAGGALRETPAFPPLDRNLS
jgi:hypothetical protein